MLGTADDRVPRREHLHDRGEVAAAAVDRVGHDGEDHAEAGAEEHGGGEHAERGALRGEDEEEQTEERAEPGARERAGTGGTAPAELAGDAFDGLQVVADDREFADGELGLRERVDGGLRLEVGLVAGDGLPVGSVG
ncbi:hypothetical protein GCM10025870_30280 [Agromyces marinus]|uniref:Uncharacterized protein n=1 Tax=Agromyces marinus TaxID=1389020 RepID=A0ABM8H573_9MICO|nr:hypothetical protein [Agromyces marinus]BDZ55955.1 hypothetical protein GCM10025870_30280 [Agromyces marinus]